MRRLVTGFLLALALGSCVTPVIPLPPPLHENLSLKELDLTAKQVVIEGLQSSPHSDALFYIFNQRTGHGTISLADHDGRFVSAPLEADDGDRLDIWAARFADDDPSSVRCEQVDYEQKALIECP